MTPAHRAATPSARTTAGHERKVAEQWVEMGHGGRHADGRVAEGRGDLELTQERGGTSQVSSVAGGLCGRCKAFDGGRRRQDSGAVGKRSTGNPSDFSVPIYFFSLGADLMSASVFYFFKWAPRGHMWTLTRLQACNFEPTRYSNFAIVHLF
jgi:hypothetical protein